MRNILMATTAISGLAIAGGAVAELKVSASGTHGLAFISADNFAAGATGIDGSTEPQGVKVITDYGIKFSGSSELDNGLTIGFSASIDPVANSDSIEVESQEVSVSGSFGKFAFGDIDSDAVLMTVTHTGQGGFFSADFGMDPIDVGDLSPEGDAAIAYYTPSIGGFKAGVAYGSDGANDTVGTLIDTDTDESIGLGASYSGDFGDAGVKIGAGYGADVSGATSNYEASIGAKITFGGFHVDGMYLQTELTDIDYEQIGIGAGYKTGPYALGIGYTMEEKDDGYEMNILSAHADYKIGAGLTFRLSADYGEYDPETGASDDGFALGTVIKTKF